MVPQWQTFIANFIVAPPQATNWKDDAELKQAFGIALAQKFKNPFEAACSIFGKETQKALWASTQWLNDPIVAEAKKNYTDVVTEKVEIPTKEQLSIRLLTFAEEKVLVNGNELYAAEAKDRLAALKLLAELQGYINNKTEINNTINNRPNFMEIRFVEPSKDKEVKVIEHDNSKEENILENSPIKLKLVG